jgi:solute:Na+ symporter, SSS family
MSIADWIVLIATLTIILVYGIYKSNASKNLEGYFLSNRSMPAWLVLLSIMGTQASAITFLSAPGQAYTDGMRFVQYYFGLPIAMVVICIFFVPVFRKLNVYTAYEYLENRFDVKTRTLTAALFLISRGLSTGISIYAPSIILSSLMGWNIYTTNLVMGGLLIFYTLSGGARAVAYTQQLQLIIIFTGMFLAGYLVVKMLPAHMGFSEALVAAGSQGKMNIITSGFNNGSFDWKDKYNIWSGLIGGFFLALSYFGTDQSQVGRYLTAKDDKESKLGLLMNGLVKIPMQLLILLVGVLVFAFYQYRQAPVFFDKVRATNAMNTPYKDSLLATAAKFETARAVGNFEQAALHRNEYKQWIKKALPGDDANDTNFIFLRFVTDYLPQGLVGLLIAVIFLAAWGSIAAALNSLAGCTVVDFHKKFIQKNGTEQQDYFISRAYTFGWGVFCVLVAMFAHNLGNSLIEAVNILGSLFYGVILGIFLVAFWLKQIKGTAVFWAAVISELLVVAIYRADVVSFLWLNAIGALLVIVLGFCLQKMWRQPVHSQSLT